MGSPTMQLREFEMPDVGEGLTEATILRWFVGPGDRVTDGMTVCEVETAKAVVELPIPFDGVVHEIRYPESSTVDIGTVVITVADEGVTQEAERILAEEDEPKQAVLVGYGVTTGARERRPRRRPSPPPPVDRRTLAKPPVRRLARDLGIELDRVPATGPGGLITRDDVRNAVPGESTMDERRIPVKGVRRATAEAMVASAFTAPHVTEFLTVDVTRTMRFLEELKADPDFAGLRVTPLLMVAKAFLTAVRRHPEINATFDAAHQEIVVKDRVNLGIAAATPRGLLVPNVKDAHTLTLPRLAAALGELTATARAGRTTPADLAGGTLTITNIGVFGVDSGTPILNPGEAVILAAGAIKRQPWVVGDEVRPRHVCTLALSFDHRLVDGELGSRVLADTGAVLERPKRLLTWS
ncbi:dihydrolipoamide acetyltransferase family protein [Amycolatopsis nalaikhensis]|uniref:Dihydrolipoamide acetyltransferase component of pyruvate dehydrogenase complex n=1 Tax=Amycolatopsis nalaikhensis TaxID=715472 RepID=A0ABY8XW47_9PSEU|nr:dihydrolipoamide acetyltransferase family protein [Amycolatopsis sp. 2-2]WIV59818.1 dihydrolipoamide acetyltransferase family protein [Amycolatopsis sp. 2-2]